MQDWKEEFEEGRLSELKEFAGISTVELYDTIGSTNLRAKELGEAGSALGTVVAAKTQTSGRGRLGRSFYSPTGGLYFSLLFPDLPAEEGLFCTPVAAVAVSRAIERVSGKATEIKWVNDLLLGGKKVCGILTETQTDSIRSFTVVGIGVNLYLPKESLPAELRDIVAGIYETEPARAPFLAGKICGAVTRDLLRWYPHFSDPDLIDAYRERSALTGLDVDVIRSGGIAEAATVLGIDKNCRLGVRYRGGREEWLLSGEVRIRIARG